MSDLVLDRANHITAARSIIDAAKTAGRADLTAQEQLKTQGHLDAVEVLDRQLKGRAMVNSITSLGSAEADAYAERGGIFTAEAKTGLLTAAKTRTAYRTEIDSKAVLVSGSLLPTSGTYVEGGLHATSQFPLASLFPHQPAPGPTIRYYRTTSGTAEVVPEDGLKPDAGVTFAAVDIALSKLACTAQFSDEMQEDAGFLIGHLEQELVAAVIAAQNELVIDTFAATVGVLTRTGASATVVDLVADSIAAQESISGLTPTAIIAHPTVIATIRKAKASTAGSYMVDVLSAVPSQLHGVRLVSSPSTPAANVWVTSGTGVVVYDRGPITVELGHNDEDFVHNRQTARAEQRLAVAVTRPSSLDKIVLT